MSSDIETGLIQRGTTDDPIYLLFRDWYVDAINNAFLHDMSQSHATFLNNVFTYTVILSAAMGAFIAGIQLIFTQLDIKIAVLVCTILILFVNLIAFVISAIAKFKDFGELSTKHGYSTNEFKKVSEDIIKLFTPLSAEEAEINLANERSFIQKEIKFFKDVSPGIPGVIAKKFEKGKKTNHAYIELIDLFTSIRLENNDLFTPIHDHIINDNIKVNNAIFEHDSDNSSGIGVNMPELQQIFNEQRN